jgi:hypothetical protein
MRTLFRLIAPVAAAVMIVLAGSSTAFAGSSSSASLDDSWCFDDVGTVYCFDITGTAHFTDTNAGSAVTVHRTTRTTVTEGGVVVGVSKSVQMERYVIQADGTIVIKTATHTRSVSGDQACDYRLVLRLVDYEVRVVNESWSCGGPDGAAA